MREGEAVAGVSMPIVSGGCWAAPECSRQPVLGVGAVEAGLLAGGPVSQALMVASGVGPGSRRHTTVVGLPVLAQGAATGVFLDCLGCGEAPAETRTR